MKKKHPTKNRHIHRGWLKNNLTVENLFPNHTIWSQISHSKMYMIKSINLAIFQAFTAACKIKFELMVIILNFLQKSKKNDNIYCVCIKAIFYKQTIIPFNISDKVRSMCCGKEGNFLYISIFERIINNIDNLIIKINDLI